MFQTKLDECGFTLLTSGLMIYIMGVYNVALHTGGLQYSTFGIAAHSFPLEWLIGFLLAFFVANRTAKFFAFRVAQMTDRTIFKILCIQTFTVCTMVPLMSLLGTLESSGLTADLPGNLAADGVAELRNGVSAADFRGRSVLPRRIPQPHVRAHARG